MSETVRIAIAGLGTVGTGTLELLLSQGGRLDERCGRPLEVTAVSDLERRDRGLDLSGIQWFDDALEMVAETPADIVVELIGGSDGVARKVCEAAIARGRHVVTANKALIAHHGVELARAAEAAGLVLAYEAAVAGGIPIVKALREGLAGNRISRITGILNGTCNHILTAMRKSGREFDEILAEAQELGYAEADPSFDVDGVDAAHKLAILASLAFGREIDFPGVFIEGIRHVSALDISYADELGYRIKLLGIARMSEHGIEQRVHPCLVPLEASLAHVEEVLNAVSVEGDFVGLATFEGRGAGARAAASAVAADIVDIARGNRLPSFAVPAASLAKAATAPMDRHRGAYYIRFTVQDRPGVIAAISAVMRDENISLESMLQHGRAATPSGPVSVVMTTHETEEAAMRRALEEIARLPSMVKPPRMIRIEPV